MGPIALDIRDLSHSYEKPAGFLRKKVSPRIALQNVSFTVEKGEIFGLLGPNGGGKTTLFKILSTYFAPSSGSATVFNLDLSRDAAEVRKRIGVVFQNPGLDKTLTVEENLTHQGHLYGMAGSALTERIQDLLRRVGLAERADERVATLSGGLQRRVEIVKSLLHSPEVLLMDEPSTGLDPGARRDLWNYLQELKKEGTTVLVTTHLMDEAEKCDRLAIINHGKLVAMGTPKALKEEIGGDVITVDARNPEELSLSIQKRFGLKTAVVDGSVRIERERGHEFIPELVQAFSGEILSATVGKPTLEDVFVHRTGHRFWTESAS